MPISDSDCDAICGETPSPSMIPSGFAGAANPAEVVGRTPWSARDALVPHPEQPRRHLAGCKQADGGVGRGPGGPPHHEGNLPPSVTFQMLHSPATKCQLCESPTC